MDHVFLGGATDDESIYVKMIFWASCWKCLKDSILAKFKFTQQNPRYFDILRCRSLLSNLWSSKVLSWPHVRADQCLSGKPPQAMMAKVHWSVAINMFYFAPPHWYLWRWSVLFERRFNQYDIMYRGGSMLCFRCGLRVFRLQQPCFCFCRLQRWQQKDTKSIPVIQFISPFQTRLGGEGPMDVDMELWLPSDEGIIAKPYNSCRNSIVAWFFLRLMIENVEGKGTNNNHNHKTNNQQPQQQQHQEIVACQDETR